MAATHDTIDGLLAEFRGYSAGMPASYHVTMSWADFRRMLDRFDAAHRREVQNALDAGGFVEASRKNKQVGNAAKMREALKHIKDRLPHMLQYIRVHWEDANAGGYFDELMLVIDAALSAPPRNCDVMDWRTAWKIWREKFHPETPAGYSAVVKGTEAFMDWFAAPATEQEGGAK